VSSLIGYCSTFRPMIFLSHHAACSSIWTIPLCVASHKLCQTQNSTYSRPHPADYCYHWHLKLSTSKTLSPGCSISAISGSHEGHRSLWMAINWNMSSLLSTWVWHWTKHLFKGVWQTQLSGLKAGIASCSLASKSWGTNVSTLSTSALALC